MPNFNYLRPGMALSLLAASALSLLAAPKAPSKASSLEEVRAETLKPYAGPVVRGVNTSTLQGKLVCGYQGWFNVEGDGAEKGWFHWTKKHGPLEPGNAKIDLWPDVSELAPDERFPTGFKFPNGKTAEVFSSFKQATVLRHFQWMRDYGIDAAFVQRFTTGLAHDARSARQNNVVLAHCREGANRFGRGYCVMYDLSGMKDNQLQEVREDWQLLRTRMHITEDAAYQKHRGKPLVTVWGVGFGDRHGAGSYSLAECLQLVEFLKQDGCTVMLGVPTYWRELKNDAFKDPLLHQIIKRADIISPWAVGRYGDAAGVARHEEKCLKPDLEWCRANGIEYMPVVFPGFSWHNMKGDRLNAIPRQKGSFFWSQLAAAKRAGAGMIYVAMFDEVDEGTAIFKCVSEVPVGPPSEFVGYEGLPSDYYLRLAGLGAKLLRGEIPFTATVPESALKR